jgi:hypothetical protein
MSHSLIVPPRNAQSAYICQSRCSSLRIDILRENHPLSTNSTPSAKIQRHRREREISRKYSNGVPSIYHRDVKILHAFSETVDRAAFGRARGECPDEIEVGDGGRSSGGTCGRTIGGVHLGPQPNKGIHKYYKDNWPMTSPSVRRARGVRAEIHACRTLQVRNRASGWFRWIVLV